MRITLFEPIYVQDTGQPAMQPSLTSGKYLQCKADDTEIDLRGQLRNFGLVGTVS